jgi:hypothetical protein
MLGASQEQQEDVASAARVAGGYLELLEQASQLQSAEPQDAPVYAIDKATKQIRLVSAA